MSDPRTGVLSLVHLARLKCIQNAHIINEIGCTPYHLIEPVLRKKTAKSLKLIEQQSPQIIPYSGPLWQSFIARDFSDRPLEQFQVRGGKRCRIPARELYEKYLEERDRQRRQAAVTLKQLTRNLTLQKNKHKVKTLDHVILPIRGGRKFEVSSNPTFRSSLLEKARHQNKLRCQFLSEAKSIGQKRHMPGKIAAPRAFQVRNTRAMVPYPVRSMDHSPEKVISKGPKKKIINSVTASPTKHKIDLSSEGEKRMKRECEANKHKKSDVYIYRPTERGG
ncbi:DEKNAAC104940 [Brettanomyces naardenensis]|uniref:DEKNAAC104940 n=1 Tax=Brettanomyces naardenensis TaxID=13370 RepID=A0A448YS91_BRENA|nr:DEKNAAC104940 [Brettanomyces naardenensis]